MVMTIRGMSSGEGYEYLLHSVVVGDGDREMSSPLTRYYAEPGCPPGTRVGTGLTSLDDGRSPALAEGDTVTEEHLARLLGEGVHPVAGERLGTRFPKLQPPRERIAARVARLDSGLRGEQREQLLDDPPASGGPPVLLSPRAGHDRSESHGCFVRVHTVIRWTPNRREMDTTLSPFARAVRIASTWLSVSGVLARLLGFATTSGSAAGAPSG